MRSVVIAAALAFTTQAALAQPGITPVREGPYMLAEPAPYTLQIIAADAAAFGMMYAGGRLEGPNGRDTDASSVLSLGGLGGHLVGAPLIHAVHRQGRRAAVSAVLRGIIPITLGTLSIFENEGCDEGLFCELDEFGTWFIAGMVIASVADWGLLSHGGLLANKKVRAHSVPMWSPTVAPAPGGAQVGLVGTF